MRYITRNVAASVALTAALVATTISSASALELDVACAMMGRDIKAIAEEHLNYPDASRDELVARYIEAALPALHATGQDIPMEKLAQIAGQFVDYVEAHSGLASEKLKEQFAADCTSGNLPR
jgi:hypothetical protein